LQQFSRQDCQRILAEVLNMESAQVIRTRLKTEFESRELTPLIAPKSMARLERLSSEARQDASAG